MVGIKFHQGTAEQLLILLSSPSSKKLQSEVEGINDAVSFPKILRQEIERLKDYYSRFDASSTTLRKMIADGVINLEWDMDDERIPFMFRKYFPIFKDIVLKEIPEADAFSYFMDRIRPDMWDGSEDFLRNFVRDYANFPPIA
jgi:hypothetical protein